MHDIVSMIEISEEAETRRTKLEINSQSDFFTLDGAGKPEWKRLVTQAVEISTIVCTMRNVLNCSSKARDAGLLAIVRTFAFERIPSGTCRNLN